MVGNNNDFRIPPNGSLFVEFADNMDHYNYALANPLPQNVLDLNYMNVAPPNQLYDNQQAYGGQQAAFGPMRFGPSYTIIGPHPPEIPPGAGVYDPNLVVPGVPGFGMNMGLY
ncbi:unnamed protein product [Adineta ricciae]|uniref:Uncharacterized protein n=1 Tax=Adineta ricciae TaxID=249248 RepID=A0A813TZS0_ADIRI|nr:unnamed protein product [Adineta ricciae]